MLIQFRFKNFASFKNEAILDLRAVSYKHMKSHVMDVGKNRVVKTLGIFGANASGKSNLVSALYYFESFVFNQFFDEGSRNDEIEKDDRMVDIRHSLYRLSEKRDKVQEFEIIFYHQEITYQYGFVMECEKEASQHFSIKEEWLYADNRLIFERNDDLITAGKEYELELKNMTTARKERLYIGILDFFGKGIIKQHVDSIKNYFKYNYNVHFEFYIESSVKGILNFNYNGKQLYKNQEYKDKVEAFIRAADIGIKEIRVDEVKFDDNKINYRIRTVHNVYDEKGNIAGEELFNIGDESSGTIRYMMFIQNFLEIIKNGGVFIVDELTARLHPILAKFIIDLYQNENNKKAQLIFTTHDTSLLNRDQFRRDEIAFIDKSAQGESNIYTLADMKTRPDASFSKDYLSGKYGAVPLIKEGELYKINAGDFIWED